MGEADGRVGCLQVSIVTARDWAEALAPKSRREEANEDSDSDSYALVTVWGDPDDSRTRNPWSALSNNVLQRSSVRAEKFIVRSAFRRSVGEQAERDERRL